MAESGRFRYGARGVTLIEIVIVVSILGIMAGVGLPGILGSILRTGPDGASRQIADDMRLAQNTAMSEGVQTRLLIFRYDGYAHDHGGAPGSQITITNATYKNKYRIERRPSALASWPAVTDNRSTNVNVLTEWKDVSDLYRGVTIDFACTIVFNSQGFRVASSSASFYIRIKRQAEYRYVYVNSIGKVTMQ